MTPPANPAKHLLFSVVVALGFAGCGPTDTGNGGNCALLPGDLVITEIYANPAGDDPGNEWFEIYNASSQSLNLKGLLLVEGPSEDLSADDTHEMREQVIEPGQYLALGGVLDEFKPAYIDYAYASDLDLGNSNRFIALRCGSTTIDQVILVSAPDAKSIGLSGNITPSHIENDNPDNFCPATSEFAPGSDGTPGQVNDICDNIVQTDCNDGGTGRAVVTPAVGDLIISEWMPDPDGADAGKEWLELAVPSTASGAIDLNGVVVDIVGKDTFTITAADCLSLSPGEFFVIAATDVSADNAGLPAVDYVRTQLEFFNSGLDRTITVSAGGTVLSTAVQNDPAPTEGAALQIDAVGVQCDAIEIYGTEGNLGTPGGPNRDCGINVDGMCKNSVGTFVPINPPQALNDLVVVEWMAGPAAGSDEWFEVTTAVAGGFDLNGVEIGDSVNPTAGQITSPDNSCVHLDQGAVLNIAKSTLGMPPGAVVPDGWSALNNSADTINVSYMGTPIAALVYGSGTYKAAVSTQVDPDGDVCYSDVAVGGPYNYVPGNSGTPAVANPQCP